MKVKYTGKSGVSFENGEVYEVLGEVEFFGKIFYRIIDESGDDYVHFLDEDFEIVEED